MASKVAFPKIPDSIPGNFRINLHAETGEILPYPHEAAILLSSLFRAEDHEAVLCFCVLDAQFSSFLRENAEAACSLRKLSLEVASSGTQVCD